MNKVYFYIPGSSELIKWIRTYNQSVPWARIEININYGVLIWARFSYFKPWFSQLKSGNNDTKWENYLLDYR